MSEIICYVCPQCSNYTGAQPNTQKKCHFCNIPMIETDMLVKDVFGRRNKETEKKMKEKYVYSNPLYDAELAERIDKEVSEHVSSIRPTMTQQNVPKCPTCGSTNIKRITAVSRGVSVGLFGIFSSKIGKTYECLNCKYKW